MLVQLDETKKLIKEIADVEDMTLPTEYIEIMLDNIDEIVRSLLIINQRNIRNLVKEAKKYEEARKTK